MFALDFGSTKHLDLKKKILLLDTTGLNGNPNEEKLERMQFIRLQPSSFQQSETLSASLYDKLEADVEQEDSVFSTRNFFLWVLGEILCEDRVLNENLGSLFRKTKYYNETRDDIPETFEKLANLFSGTIVDVREKQLEMINAEKRRANSENLEEDRFYD